PGLHALLSHNMPWLDLGAGLPDPNQYDCQCALLSLPLRFLTRLGTIPAPIPYLRTPPEAAQRWMPRLRQGTELKVGLAWAGNPRHINDLRRSIGIESLASPLMMPGVRLFGLQVGPHAGDVLRLPAGAVTDLSPYLTDFVETAGAVESLDLVVTVDTSVAHLAGALGKPVWVLLPSVPDWRWLLDREDSPWYPTMRLFRQTGNEGWGGVVSRVGAELRAVSGGARERLLPPGRMVR
ncbi:MAG TPA: hypothetical protein VK433_12105, partial [Stellaceae bacterium]|nr:hypothetical protein [Stellaceae bacterium]